MTTFIFFFSAQQKARVGSERKRIEEVEAMDPAGQSSSGEWERAGQRSIIVLPRSVGYKNNPALSFRILRVRE